jgi:hypothetical protein
MIHPVRTRFADLDDAATTSARLVPAGGTSGQVLAKSSGTDYATSWVTVSAGVTLPSTTSLLKGNGSGGAVAAVAGTDFVSPSGSYSDPLWITSLSGTKISGTVGAATVSGSATTISGNIPESQVTGLVADLAGKAPALAPTAVKTSAYSAAAGDFVPVDTTSGAVTITLPTAPADGSRIAAKLVIQGGTNAVTINCGGSDVFNKTGGSTSATLTLLNQSVNLQYKAGIWYVVGDDLPLSQLDLRYATQSAFVASGASHAKGLVPDPGSTAGTTRFLREDATWQLVAGLTIGNAVSGGGANRVLYEDGSGNLAASVNMTFVSGTGLTVGGGGLLLDNSQSVQVKGSGGTYGRAFYCDAGNNMGWRNEQSSGSCYYGIANFSNTASITFIQNAGRNLHQFGPDGSLTFLLNSSADGLLGTQNCLKVVPSWANSTTATRKGRASLLACDFTGTDREGVRVESDGTQPLLSFYGKTPAVAKAATPTTLADVIAILQGLGLCS